MVHSKSSLAVFLSKLRGFTDAKVKIEQYTTESEIAAQILWDAYMKGDIKERTVADLGAGTGILGIGALLLGAEKVYFVEIDKDAISVLQENLSDTESIFAGISGKWEIINSDVSKFTKLVDVVVQNPPFGTKEKHADKEFLQKAFEISDLVYSFHKSSTLGFVKAIAKDCEFTVSSEEKFSYPLKSTMSFHKKRIERIEVSCFRLLRSKLACHC